jgi:hypothetical protein
VPSLECHPGVLAKEAIMIEGDLTRMDLRAMGLWGKAARIAFANGYEDVWVRTLADRTEALERGHEAMQRKLLEYRDGGERRQALHAALLLASTEELVSMALEAERVEREARVRRELPDPVAPRQDRTAGESDQDFATRVAAHGLECSRTDLKRRGVLENRREERRRELRALPKEQLAALAEPRRIDIECWNAFAQTCDDWVLLRAVRRVENCEEQYFSDLAEVRALHPQVKEQLRRAYRDLEPAEGDAFPKG